MKLHLSFLPLLVVPALAMADSDQFELNEFDLDQFDSELFNSELFDSELFDSEQDVDHMERELLRGKSRHFKERLGQCRGATGGVWGDPHIVTLDGLAYDCQGRGLFTIMKNHMYNIQGHFTDTGTAAARMFKAKKSKWKPTVTNDVMIDFLQSPDRDNKYPIFQFSFGNITHYDGQPISEKGCNPDRHFEPLQRCGWRSKRVGSINHCRNMCQRKPGCRQFTFFESHSCYLNDGNGTETENPERWSRGVTGTLDSKCGKKWPLPQLLSDKEDAVSGQIGPRCPLLFHIDGELQDVSSFGTSRGKKHGYLFGNAESDVSVYFRNGKLIQIKYTLASGDIAEVHLRAGGHGPGELWGCYWNVYVCLPEVDQEIFEAGGFGLLGTPNDNKRDDWMTPSGKNVEIDFSELRRQAATDYCEKNWCVSQEDSIMVPTAGQTYEDVKCAHEEYIDFDVHDPGCLLEADTIIECCKGMPTLLKYPCEVDCCVGGCDEMQNITNELTNLIQLSEEPASSQYGVPDHRDCNVTEFVRTGETVCPRGSGDAVKLLHSSGSMPLPEDAVVIYGIEMNTEPHDGATGESVRFKVNNFLEDRAHVYVKHEKSAFNNFLDPVCETLERKSAGCDANPQIIEAGCYNYNGITPFALVTVYVQSGEIDSSDTAVDTCCDEKQLMNSGVAEYTFEIYCECPPAAIA